MPQTDPAHCTGSTCTRTGACARWRWGWGAALTNVYAAAKLVIGNRVVLTVSLPRRLGPYGMKKCDGRLYFASETAVRRARAACGGCCIKNKIAAFESRSRGKCPAFGL